MIAVVGGFGVGLTMRLNRAPEAGETVTGGVLSAGPGGKGSNQAIGIARLGHDVQLCTAVGTDAAGADAVTLWEGESVGWAGVVRTDEPTMTGFILVDSAGENRIAIAPGALGELTEQHIDAFRDTVASAELLLISLEVPLEAALHAARLAIELGTPCLLNPAPAWPLSDEHRIADIITPNSSEARILLGLDPADPRSDEDIAVELAERLDCSVVLTLGSRGAIVVSGALVEHIAPAPVVHVVDTTGAGDAFAAALAVAVVEGAPLAEAARWAASAGAHAVTVAEVIPSLPHRTDLGPIPTPPKESA